MKRPNLRENQLRYDLFQFEIALQTRLEEVERRLAKYEGQQTEPVPQEPEYNEEAEWTPLPEDDYETEIWSHEAEWAPLPHDEDEEPEVPVVPMETSGNGEPEESVRELVL